MSASLHKKKFYTTPFHLVDPSPWPILTSLTILQIPFSLVLYWDLGSLQYFFYSILCFSGVLFLWLNDVIIESTFQGMHTKAVQTSASIGFALFILSEAMLFMTFFCSCFYYTVEPTAWTANLWPPSEVSLVYPLAVPLLNSVILLTSSVFITFAHYELTSSCRQVNYNYVSLMTFMTIIFGLIFLICQAWEYSSAQFSMQDTVFGSMFYLMTGFHGLHVLFGIIFLTVTLLRLRQHQFTKEHHLGFEFAALYWHFVDTIWFFVYTILYCLTF